MNTDLVVRLSYNFDLDEFRTFFPQTEVIDVDRDRNTKIDLLIFPGGEDVTPSYYLRGQELKKFQNYCNSSPARDMAEFLILEKVFDGEIKVGKILGVCRGSQFLNVMFGGTLFPDLGYYDRRHPAFHKLYHMNSSNLNFFQEVNSLHHQGLNRIGTSFKGKPAKPFPIASDEFGFCTEIVTWFRDKVLGVQFHPEYYDERNPDKSMFREFLTNWALNKVSVF